MAVNVNDLKRELHELIAALDRRVRRVEQAGEADIARDAAALREKAVQRLRELDEQSTVIAPEGAAPLTDQPDAPLGSTRPRRMNPPSTEGRRRSA